MGWDEGLHKGCGRDVANLERFVIFVVGSTHHGVKFTGLAYFCMNGMRAIRPVIDTLGTAPTGNKGTEVEYYASSSKLARTNRK